MATVAELLAVESNLNETKEALAALADDADKIWILIAGFLVFWMHAGFTMLEAGSVQHKNAVNIMFKNLGTICIGAIMYYICGYAFAFGVNSNESEFIGNDNFFIGDADRHFWFFQFAFCATAATIVSGAVAGRVNLTGYFILAAYVTAFVYPVVTHWVWNTGGWLSAFQDDDAPIEDFLFEGCGLLDYAGSGVVHMTGGVAAFWAALILGPRLGRFDSDGTPVAIPPHNIALQTLGVFILWFGWYGFNCGSTLAFDGVNAGKVAVTTTLSPSAAVLTVMAVSRFTKGYFDIGSALNAALGGLVSITAGCPSVSDWGAILIGIIGGFVYLGGSKLMLKIKLDDPVDAIAVHGICGAWGVVATAIFMQPEFVASGYSTECERGNQFGTQVVGVLAIFGWVSATVIPVVLLLKVTKLLRVSAEMEEAGLDSSEHGGAAGFTGGEMSAKVSA